LESGEKSVDNNVLKSNHNMATPLVFIPGFFLVFSLLTATRVQNILNAIRMEFNDSFQFGNRPQN
jgi:hypothetical protein